MKRALHRHERPVARALAAAGALACLLFSDGVGPRLVPYPEALAVRPAAAHATESHLGTDRDPLHERALIALGVKLSSLKQDRATHPSDTAGAASAARRPFGPSRLLARRTRAAAPAPSSSPDSLSSNPHRGPPALS